MLPAEENCWAFCGYCFDRFGSPVWYGSRKDVEQHLQNWHPRHFNQAERAQLEAGLHAVEAEAIRRFVRAPLAYSNLGGALQGLIALAH